MRRHRDIAASPLRSTISTVETIAALVRDTLSRSDRIDTQDADVAIQAARPALLALVAGGHTEKHGVVICAADLHLTINTVSGDGALALDENLDAVPGAGTAETWTMYLPTPAPVSSLVKKCAETHPRLSTESPPQDSKTDASQAAQSGLDRSALLRRGASS